LAGLEFEIPSWDYFYQLCLELGGRVRESGFKPDVLLGISRGGLVPVRILSDLFDKAEVATVRVEFYEDIAKTAREPRITQPVSVDVKGRSVLVVDDVADTGRSLALVKRRVEELGAAHIRVATTYYKPWSVIVPDYWVRRTEKWIVFPHERRETALKVARRILKEGGTLEQAHEALVAAGMEPILARRFLRDASETPTP